MVTNVADGQPDPVITIRPTVSPLRGTTTATAARVRKANSALWQAPDMLVVGRAQKVSQPGSRRVRGRGCGSPASARSSTAR